MCMPSTCAYVINVMKNDLQRLSTLTVSHRARPFSALVKRINLPCARRCCTPARLSSAAFVYSVLKVIQKSPHEALLKDVEIHKEIHTNILIDETH